MAFRRVAFAVVFWAAACAATATNAPSAVITGPAFVCPNSEGNQVSVPDAGPEATYDWTLGPGSIATGFGTRSLTFIAPQSGDVLVTVTVTSPSGSASGSSTIPTSPCGPRAFFTVVPCRLMDTRLPAGAGGGPSLNGSGVPRLVTIAGKCGVPTSAKAVAVNLTVTGGTTSGFITINPSAPGTPFTSTINFSVGKTRASNAIAALRSGGDVRIYCVMGDGETADVILDVAGYFE
jgi:PKD domain-containing protein